MQKLDQFTAYGYVRPALAWHRVEQFTNGDDIISDIRTEGFAPFLDQLNVRSPVFYARPTWSLSLPKTGEYITPAIRIGEGETGKIIAQCTHTQRANIITLFSAWRSRQQELQETFADQHYDFVQGSILPEEREQPLEGQGIPVPTRIEHILARSYGDTLGIHSYNRNIAANEKPATHFWLDTQGLAGNFLIGSLLPVSEKKNAFAVHMSQLGTLRMLQEALPDLVWEHSREEDCVVSSETHSA